MTLTITPSRLAGAVTPPPSKSQAHRLLIAAALGSGESVVRGVSHSQDMEATLDCLEELGAEFTRRGDAVIVQGLGANAACPLRRMAYPRLDCGESGSTLRFLIPLALALRGGGTFTGRGRLMERPQRPYFDLFEEKGISYGQRDGLLTVQGRLTPGEYRLPGNVSSQFITGLLYALPLLEGDSYIIPTTPVESWDYILMTMEALFAAGVAAEEPREGCPYFYVHGGQSYSAGDFTVEPDWSQAGFWYAAMYLDNPVEIQGLNPHSVQGDKVIADHFARLGREGDGDVDVSGCPDLVPPLAVMSALRPGKETRLVNAARLRLKESDRLASVTAVLVALGADVAEGEDFLVVRGREALPGGVTVDSYNDHRIAMMAAIAATRCQRPITLTGAEAVNKSYPSFWEEYVRLGGKIQEERA